MSNIREIEVNGEKFGLESVNDVYVSRQEPNEEVMPNLWYKPASFKGLYDIGMEMAIGSTNARGNYTLDENGQLVETTDTNSYAPRTTKMFSILRNNQYTLFSRNSISGYAYPFAVYFYDSNKEFISKSEFITDETVTYPAGFELLHINPPANTRYLRIIQPYTYGSSSYIYFAFADISAEEKANILNGMAGTSMPQWHYYDEDCYVKL